MFLTVWAVYRRQLPHTPIEAAPDTRLALHYPLMIKTVVAGSGMLAAFLAGVPIAIVAIAGAAVTLFTRRVKPQKVYREISRKLLVLFAGLFVVTAGVERTGLVDVLLD